MLLDSPMLFAPKPSVSTVRSSSGYALVWRQKKLVVRRSRLKNAIWIPETVDLDWLVLRLSRSPVQLVLLDVRLGVEGLRFWAEAAHRAGKPVYINLKGIKRVSSAGGIATHLFDRSRLMQWPSLLRIVWLNLIALVMEGWDERLWQSNRSGVSSGFYVDRQGQILKLSRPQELGLRSARDSSQTLFSRWRLLRGAMSLSTAYFQSLEHAQPWSPEV